MIKRYEQVKEELVNTSLESISYKQGYLQAYRDIMEALDD